MSEENPFTKCHRALFDLLVAWPPLASGDYKIRAANWVSSLSDRKNTKPKTAIQDSDFQEIWLRTAGAVPHIQRTSNASSCLRRYEILLSTNIAEIDRSLLPVEWEILRAMSTWMATLRALTWNGKVFVVTCKPTEITHSLDDIEANRGTPGWSAVWAAEAEMFFQTTDLQNPAL